MTRSEMTGTALFVATCLPSNLAESIELIDSHIGYVSGLSIEPTVASIAVYPGPSSIPHETAPPLEQLAGELTKRGAQLSLRGTSFESHQALAPRVNQHRELDWMLRLQAEFDPRGILKSPIFPATGDLESLDGSKSNR